MWRFALCVSIRMSATIVWLFAAPGLYAQADDVQGRMERVLRYTGVDDPAPADVARMAELWTRAQQPGLEREERRLAFRDMYLLYGKLHGRDLASRPQALDGFTQFVMSTFEGGGRMVTDSAEDPHHPTLFGDSGADSVGIGGDRSGPPGRPR